MKLFLAFAVVLISISSFAETASSARQIVINVDRQDFKPIQDVSWRVMVGNSNLTLGSGPISSSGSGLGVGIEKMLTDRWSLGGYYSNVRALTSDSSGQIFSPEANQYVKRTSEYRENIGAFSAYGKYSFVNYPINKWNLVQVSILGGMMVVEHSTDVTDGIYGAAVSYNYDNIIGFELNSKVDLRAESFTSANLIGYF